MNTCLRTLLSRFHNKTICCSEKYNATRKALLNLDPHSDWTQRFKHLDPKTDLQPPRHDEDDLGEGRRKLSWIWLVSRGIGTVASAEEINDSKYCLSQFCAGTRAEYLGFVTCADFCYLTAMAVEWVKTK
jgi:hypothetical protein